MAARGIARTLHPLISKYYIGVLMNLTQLEIKCWKAIFDATLISKAHRFRAEQLTQWSRKHQVLNYCIAPSFLLVATQVNNPTFLSIAVIISGALSTVTFIWGMANFIHKHERQLFVSIDLPLRADGVVSDLKIVMDNIDWSQPSQIHQNQIDNYLEKLKGLRHTLETEQIYVENWMNIIAQQHTMRIEDIECGICNSKLTELQLNIKNAKKRAKKIKHNDEDNPEYCHCCGQKIRRSNDGPTAN